MKRDHKLIMVFSAVSVLAASAVGVGIPRTTRRHCPRRRRSPRRRDRARRVLSVQFVGDTMLGDAAQPVIDQFGYDWPLQFARESLTGTSWWRRPRLDQHDHLALGPEQAVQLLHLPGGRWRAGPPGSTRSHSRTTTFDVGSFGLTDTMVHAEAAGMATFGAGPDLARAEQPLLLRTQLAPSASSGWENFGTRGHDEAGTVQFNPKPSDAVSTCPRCGRGLGDRPCALGHNYAPIDGQQRYWAQQLADAGYDMVIGSTAPRAAHRVHRRDAGCLQCRELAFGAPGRFRDFAVPGLGLAVSVDLSPDRAAHLPCVACSPTTTSSHSNHGPAPAEAQAPTPAEPDHIHARRRRCAALWLFRATGPAAVKRWRQLLCTVLLLTAAMTACTDRASAEPEPGPHGRPGSEQIKPGRGVFTFDGYPPLADRPVRVWYDAPADPSTAQILIVMHGVGRNGADYRDDWHGLVDGRNVLVLAPEFSDEEYPGAEAYNRQHSR
jgi:poly-gamma-glutamate synthesis protein (capsule biosynthesis protein)